MTENEYEWAVVEYISLDVPCPFCGCDSGELLQLGDEACWEVECAKCWARVRGESRQEALSAWNRRAERTCHHKDGAFGIETECGARYDVRAEDAWSYCPNCGAKVVSDVFKKLFCKHDHRVFIRNIHDGEIILMGWERSIWRCQYCGKILFDHKPYKGTGDI